MSGTVEFNHGSRIARSALTLLLAIVVLLPGIARAEVGVSVAFVNGDAPRPAPALYVWNLTIVDEDGPFAAIWAPLGDGFTPVPGERSWSLERPGGRVVLNPEGNLHGDGPPSMNRIPGSNVPLAAWAMKTGNGFDVVTSRFVDGAWTDPESMAVTGSDERDPKLVVDAGNGTIYLTYWIDDSDPRVMLRTASATDLVWSSESRISAHDEAAMRPNGVVRGDRLLLIYESHFAGGPATPRSLVVAEETGHGMQFEIVGTTQHTQPGRAEIHTDGTRTWADWIDADDEMAWTWRTTGSAWSTPTTEPFWSLEEREFHARPRIRGTVLQQTP